MLRLIQFQKALIECDEMKKVSYGNAYKLSKPLVNFSERSTVTYRDSVKTVEGTLVLVKLAEAIN